MDEDLGEFVASRYRALLRTAYLMTGDRHHAEDLVQDALARMWLAAGRGAIDNPDAYVRRVMANAFISSTRRRRELALGDREGLVIPDPSHAVDEHARMWQAMLALPPRQRAVLVLRYYEGLSEAEICEVLAVSPGTVRSQTSKARAKLRDLLSDTMGAQL